MEKGKLEQDKKDVSQIYMFTLDLFTELQNHTSKYQLDICTVSVSIIRISKLNWKPGDFADFLPDIYNSHLITPYGYIGKEFDQGSAGWFVSASRFLGPQLEWLKLLEIPVAICVEPPFFI